MTCGLSDAIKCRLAHRRPSSHRCPARWPVRASPLDSARSPQAEAPQMSQAQARTRDRSDGPETPRTPSAEQPHVQTRRRRLCAVRASATGLCASRAGMADTPRARPAGRPCSSTRARGKHASNSRSAAAEVKWRERARTRRTGVCVALTEAHVVYTERLGPIIGASARTSRRRAEKSLARVTVASVPSAESVEHKEACLPQPGQPPILPGQCCVYSLLERRRRQQRERDEQER